MTVENITKIPLKRLQELINMPIPLSLANAPYLAAEKNAILCMLKYNHGALESRFSCLEEQEEFYLIQSSLYWSSIMN